MMSGSWRRKARSATAKVSPAFSLTLTWLTPGELDFRRVFGGRDIDAGLVQKVKARVKRDGLPAAGRASDQDHPVRTPDCVHQRRLLVRLVPQGLDAELDAGGIEDTHHDLFAEERRQRAHPEIDRLRFRQHDLHPAVLRHALLRDVELGDHLDPGRELVLDHERRLGDLHEDPVEPVPDPVEFFVRLEVDVRDAGLNGVDQDFLQVADDRRILDLGAFLFAALRAVGLLEVDLEVLHAACVFEQGAGRLDELVDRSRQLVVFDDDGLDDEIRLEPDLFQALQVRRIRRGDIEPVAALVQRQNVPRLGNLEVDQVFRVLIDVEARKVE